MRTGFRKDNRRAGSDRWREREGYLKKTEKLKH
jgi:hypothetical protein